MTSTPLLLLLLLFISSSSAAPTPVDIGVILDHGSSVGETCQVSLALALSDFYSPRPNSTTKLRLHFRNSPADDVASAASAAVDLISTVGVAAILGPQTSSSASFVADIGAKSHVPIVSFSATSPSISTSASPYFVRAAVADSAAATPIAAVVQHFKWRRVVPVYEDSDFGSSFVSYLVDALNSAGSQVPYRVRISVSSSDDRILADMYRLKTMQTRVFVVHAKLNLAARVFANAKKAGLMDAGFVWIVTDGVTGSVGTTDPSPLVESMQGAIGVEPSVPKSNKLRQFKRHWRREFLKRNPNSDIVDVSTFGIWAYDAFFALAMAAEASQPLNSAATNNSQSSLSTLPVSKSGQKFLESIQSTSFLGLAGEFSLPRRELNPPAFKIVNIIGEKGHGIGFWTPADGLTRRLKEPGSVGLGLVHWPGDSSGIPKGFAQPTSGERMRIAVPGKVEPGFHAFLNAMRDPTTNETTASGFVIEVFEAAVRRLPYALPFEYVLADEGAYNTLVQQVPKKYEAVVGDVTITAKRSSYVDFTMPYTFSGISMVVPMKDDNRSAWIFLKPLKADLWIVSGFFFIFTGIVVWLLEHRINPEFRGPPSHQAGTTFYFIFSTLVFSHKETVVSNLSRIVVIVWVFVVLILSSSYTANLTSMLTVRQLQPTVPDLQALQKTNENVGFLQNSFVRGFLKDMGFQDSRLKPYKSPQMYAEALKMGTGKGGVGAIVDEIPYLNVFLRDYCANYTIAGRTNKTGGFGFVFPKGSPIVPDLSRAILNLTESDEMAEIERKWFGDPTTCPDESSPFNSKSLSFENFGGLFLITGIASILCLIIFLLSFWYKNRHVLNNIAADDSLKWSTKSIAIARRYDEKDLNSHTFRRESVIRRRSMAGIEDPTASPSTDNVNLESPMSTYHHYTFEDGSPSVEIASPRAETPPHIELMPTVSN